MSNKVHCKRRGSEKSTFLAIFRGFWFSQHRLFSRKSTRKPLNLVKSPIFTNTPCKSTCHYNAPSMHTVDKKRKKSTKILTFWARRLPGVFHSKGWGSKSSCHRSKVCLPWVSREGTCDVPRILRGCPGPLRVFKKVCAKKVCAHLSFPI